MFLSVGELLLRSEGLNMQVSDCLSSRAASLTSPADQSNPFGLYDYLLVYHPEEHTATMELLTAVEKGLIYHSVGNIRRENFLISIVKRRIFL